MCAFKQGHIISNRVITNWGHEMGEGSINQIIVGRHSVVKLSAHVR